MFYLIYKISHLETGKFYIGAHKTSNIDDGYMGSGLYITRAIAKYGISAFTKEILHILSSEEDMWKKEADLVNEDFLLTANTYNIKLGGNGGFTSTESKKGRQRTNQVLQEKYGDDWRSVIGKKGHLASINIRQHNFQNDSDYRDKCLQGLKKGNIAANSEEAKQKRKETMKQSGHQQGEKNSQFGSRWIHNPVTLENKKIRKDDIIPEGWNKGRKIKMDT